MAPTCPRAGAQPYELVLEPMRKELRLEGSKNYMSWSRRVKTMLRVNRVEHYLEETSVEPDDKSSVEWEVWTMTNARVMIWLWNSMSPSIEKMVVFEPTAAQMWKKLKSMYLVICSGEMSIIQWKAEQLKQEGRTVDEYARKLQKLWAKLDDYDPLQLHCGKDIMAATAWLQRRRVIHFLNGLNEEFLPRRIDMFCQATLPTMEEAISAMVQEEIRLGVIKDRKLMSSANNRKCYNCGQEGHLSYNCPSERNSDGRGGGRRGFGGYRGRSGGSRGHRGGHRGDH
ncbi:hypothetical protein ACP70R_021379 [Stipagrostis hirtigluma subsp. patula]